VPCGPQSAAPRSIDAMVKEAHNVLSCKHYSLYDIRIDADEQPYILEAALFCSFSPLSVIPAMAQQAGRDDLVHPKLFHSFLERASRESKAPESCLGKDSQGEAYSQPYCPPTLDTVDTLQSNAVTSSSGEASSIGEDRQSDASD